MSGLSLNSGANRVIGVANNLASASTGTVQISPFGQFPHARGLQHFDRTDATNLMNEFAKQKALAAGNFAGLPWYCGHPDRNPQAYPDKRAFGWITSLETRSDGLYGNVRWTPAGDQLIQDDNYKFCSPVWDVESATVAGKRVLRPTHLVSVGFTNSPNLPVSVLRNEAEPSKKPRRTTDAGKELGALIDATMIECGVSYDCAWRRVKQSRPDIFRNMAQPTNPPFLTPTNP